MKLDGSYVIAVCLTRVISDEWKLVTSESGETNSMYCYYFLWVEPFPLLPFLSHCEVCIDY